MPLNFPNSPSLNDTHTDGNVTWSWNGQAWDLVPEDSPSFVNVTLSGRLYGNVTGDVIGTVSSISNHSLNDLDDVSLSNLVDSQVLAYDANTETWTAITLSSTFTGGQIPNALFIASNTSSNNTVSGALRVTGGAGIGGNINAGGFITTEDSIRLIDSGGSNYVGFIAPSNVSSSVAYVLPSSDGTPGQVLSTNGSGVLAWSNAGGGGGGSSIGGSDTQIQYNSNGVFAGKSTFIFDTNTDTMTIRNIYVNSTTASVNSTSGSIVTLGGVGVGGRLNVAGTVNTFSATTGSSSSTTGTLVVAGGVGIGQNLYVGGIASSDSTPTDPKHLTTKEYVDSKSLGLAMAFGV